MNIISRTALQCSAIQLYLSKNSKYKIMQLEEDFGTEIVICKCEICGNCIFNSERGEEFCLACKKGFHKNKKLF